MSKVIWAKISDVEINAEYFPASPNTNSGNQNTLLICLPGGGASAAYFDLAPDHSFVKRMTQSGYSALTLDHPGTATNPLPEDYAFLTPRQSANIMALSLAEMLPQISQDNTRIIGLGHSMGGMMATLIQSQSKLFERLVLLGSSAGGLEWGLSEDERIYMDDPVAFARDIETLTLGKFRTNFPEGTGGPSGKSITFGGETEALTKALRDVSCQLFAAGGMMSMTRGSFRGEVASIDIPIFFAFGDHDIGITPEDAPKDYKSAPSTELLILENTGHNHFAFSSIETLCEQLDHWLTKAA